MNMNVNMNRTEILRLEREKVINNLTKKDGKRAKWLIILMDIDDEIEEIAENSLKAAN